MTEVTKIVGLNQRCSAHSESLKVQEMTGYHLEHAGEAIGKPRGFGRRDVGARTPQNELYV